MSAEVISPKDKEPTDPSITSITTPGLALPLDNDHLGVRPSASLPAGFSYGDVITSRELSALQNTVAVLGLTTEDDIYTEHAIRHARGDRLIGIGVRSDDDARLIGYGLLVIFPEQTGYFFDFMVHPGARSRGIGKAIIDERITQADRLGLTSVKVKIGSSNTLRSYYLDRGFREHVGTIVLKRMLGGVAQAGV